MSTLNNFWFRCWTCSKIYIWMQERVIVYLDRFRWCHLQHHKYKLIWIQKTHEIRSWKFFKQHDYNYRQYHYIGVSLLLWVQKRHQMHLPYKELYLWFIWITICHLAWNILLKPRLFQNNLFKFPIPENMSPICVNKMMRY